MQINLYQLYNLMLDKMGNPNWWPADSKEEIILGAILVQNTNWNNVCKSLLNLKELTAFKPEKIIKLEDDVLIDAIRPSGFYNNKSKAIKAVFNWLYNHQCDYDMIARDYQVLRDELLKLHGVGFETADSLLLYVFDQKRFICDKYSQRLFEKLGVSDVNSYKKLEKKIILSEDFSLDDAKIFHGLIVEFSKVNLKSDKLFKLSFLADKTLIL